MDSEVGGSIPPRSIKKIKGGVVMAEYRDIHLEPEKEKMLTSIAMKFMEMNLENIDMVTKYAELMLLAQNTVTARTV